MPLLGVMPWIKTILKSCWAGMFDLTAIGMFYLSTGELSVLREHA